jgi:hypothetical protein
MLIDGPVFARVRLTGDCLRAGSFFGISAKVLNLTRRDKLRLPCLII